MSSSIRNWVLRSTTATPPPEQAAVDVESQQPNPRPTVRQMNETTSTQPEMEERRGNAPPAGRWRLSRPTIPSFFGGRRVSMERDPQQQQQPRPSSSHYSEVESPKTPNFALGMPPLPSTRLHLPNLARTWSHGSNGQDSRPGTSRPGDGATMGQALEDDRPPSRIEGPMFPEVVNPPRAAHVQDRPRASEESFSGVSGETTTESSRHDRRRRRDQRRENETEEERRKRRRHRHRRRRERERREAENSTKKRFLCCFPWPKSKHVRSQILKCFVSGTFLLCLLIIYLALALTRNITTSEFTVLLILIILFTAIVFCHGLVRLCLYLVKSPSERQRHDEQEAEEEAMMRRQRRAMQQTYAPGGFAIPDQPIRVVLARDEEAAGIESETTKFKPPAYGLWRESVRVDPNRIYWQRNDHPALRGGGGTESDEDGPSVRRPPSYVSDDGVSYVVEARPRSMAPTMDVPLPTHPSEVGRGATPPLPTGRW